MQQIGSLKISVRETQSKRVTRRRKLWSLFDNLRALALWPTVHEALRQIQALLAASNFERLMSTT